MTEKVYWLFSGHVVTSHRNGTEHRKLLNTVLTTDGMNITRYDLSRVQESLQKRFVTECPQIPGFKITDVYIEGFSLLGQMSAADFNAGFETSAKDSSGKPN